MLNQFGTLEWLFVVSVLAMVLLLLAGIYQRRNRK